MTAKAPKYPFPPFLDGVLTRPAYTAWLQRKAAAHVKRDRKRGNPSATIEEYKLAIHKAVLASEGCDVYTGETLRWDLVSTYDNEASKAAGRSYKATLALLPTVDHVDDGLGPADFVICAWRTNDAKNDLSFGEFLALCRRVIAHADKVHEKTAEAEPYR
jgi:hypothetical protein